MYNISGVKKIVTQFVDAPWTYDGFLCCRYNRTKLNNVDMPTLQLNKTNCAYILSIVNPHTSKHAIIALHVTLGVTLACWIDQVPWNKKTHQHTHNEKNLPFIFEIFLYFLHKNIFV